MRRGRRMTIWFAAGLLVAFPAIATGITLNQVDMFQGSTDSWTDGHGGGNYWSLAPADPTAPATAIFKSPPAVSEGPRE